MPRLSSFSLVALVLSCVLCTTAQAQRRSRHAKKKPFAELSSSAQRLRDSLVARLDVGPDVGDSANVVVRSTSLPSSSEALIVAARSQIGTRYVFGAEKPFKALDCSSLVRFVMSALRIDLPRTAQEQAQQGVHVAKDVTGLRTGDLLTFGQGKLVSHIGVYVGKGRFIHASTSQRQVVEESIERQGTWFRRNWVGVRRLLAAAPAADSAGT